MTFNILLVKRDTRDRGNDGVGRHKLVKTGHRILTRRIVAEVAVASLSAIGLSGCAVGPDYSVPIPSLAPFHNAAASDRLCARSNSTIARNNACNQAEIFPSRFRSALRRAIEQRLNRLETVINHLLAEREGFEPTPPKGKKRSSRGK